MEIFNIKNLSFTYPDSETPALESINLNVNPGDFILLIGESGCGKTTLLRMLKKELTPYGKTSGEIFYKGKKIKEINQYISASEIGFIMQDPDSQIVTDKVYSELAFGLENLGYNNTEIRLKVSEFASYFGLSKLFNKDTNSLSGGEKQLLNLASVMAMNPDVIILDEPTSQLDPIAATEFINTIKRLNNDLGLTVIIAEHHLQELFAIADKVAVMESSKLIYFDTPKDIVPKLRNHKISKALPASARIFNSLSESGECPLTVRDGRKFLQKNYNDIDEKIKVDCKVSIESVIACKDIWFRYSKEGADVLKNCDFNVYKGELYALLGENGCGKSTLLKCISKNIKPYRGKIDTFGNKVGFLPQNPKNLFVKDSLEEDFKLINYSYLELLKMFNIEHLLNKHPYDLSGGELQKAGIVKVLLTNPEVLLLDEPTKGLDSFSKEELGKILLSLNKSGLTIFMVTHDVEFAAEYANRCGLLFDGNITAENDSNSFFTNNNFYTTTSARISRNILKNAVTVNDVVTLCKSNELKKVNNND